MGTAKHEGAETLSRALAALREGDLDEAEKLSAELLVASPQDPAAHQLAAAVALKREHFPESERWARSCLALRPNHSPTMMIAARAARGLGDFASAKDWLGRVSAISPSDPASWFQLALTQIESADTGTTASLAALAQRFPGEADGWREIGAALARVNDLAGAESAFARAANASSNSVHALNLGRVLLARARPREAVDALRRALASAPGRLEPLLPLAQALRLIGAPREARQHLQLLANAEPNNAPAFYALGLVCDDLRDWPAAIAAYRRCAELQPDMPEARVNLGLALQQTGELDQAIECYREALRLRPEAFGRIAQALPSTQKGALWLSMRKLRRSLSG